MMKMVVENPTCFSRSRLLVVVPHSRSIVPFISNGIRFCEVTLSSFTCNVGIFSCCLTASTILVLMS